MGNIKKAIYTFCKAQCSAWVASAIDFGVTIILAKVCGMWYAYATFLGAVSGGVANCQINYRWVFHAKGLKKKYLAMRYVLVWAVSIVLNTYGTYKLTEATRVDFIIVKIAVAAVVAVLWNYQMQRTFVFHANNKNKTK